MWAYAMRIRTYAGAGWVRRKYGGLGSLVWVLHSHRHGLEAEAGAAHLQSRQFHFNTDFANLLLRQFRAGKEISTVHLIRFPFMNIFLPAVDFCHISLEIAETCLAHPNH